MKNNEMTIEKAEKKWKKNYISISAHEIGFLKVHRFIPLRILWEQAMEQN